MKVTDKRMFTPEGELREEYRFLEERAKAGAEEAATGQQERRAEAPPPSPSPEIQPGARLAPDVPGFEASAGPGPAPAFLDLLGVMAEPIPFYLGDARLPTGESGENLEAARFYIDLLDVLRQKTAGNLAPQEADALEDLLYRLRLRYVQKRR
jgi:hypothetical protein